jgi:hypothetical protein
VIEMLDDDAVILHARIVVTLSTLPLLEPLASTDASVVEA